MNLIGKEVILLDDEMNNILAAGILSFIGENKMINWDLQVTINRTPYKIKSKDQVIPYDEEVLNRIKCRKFYEEDKFRK